MTSKTVVLVSNGDFRHAVGRACWPKQQETLDGVCNALKQLGADPVPATEYDAAVGHGFIHTQAQGCRVFAGLDPEVPVIVVLSCWAYAHHVASSLATHRGPILILGNFDGTWPGLVALLNHCGSLDRMGIVHSRIWSERFDKDALFLRNLRSWLETGAIQYPMDHMAKVHDTRFSSSVEAFGRELARDILQNKRILGQLDPGCMGMLNAVMSLDKLASIGMPVEYLNQSDLLAEMWLVTEEEARGCYQWICGKGATFLLGEDPATDLVEDQILEQMKMYIAAGRIYERYGLSAIGIPYQYGMVRVTCASDLPEGMLNNADRPDIVSLETGVVINQGRIINHFNEGDLGSGVPQVLMHDILVRKGMPAETTLHDVRWGDTWEGRFVWVFEISGGAPPAHFNGWDRTEIYRQPAMYFPKGGGTCAGVSKPGAVTWARVYESFGELAMDCGTGEVVAMPGEEVMRRREATTREWPIANTVIPGLDRDRLMSTHKSNHITICYGDILEELIVTARHIGLAVHVAGDAMRRLQT